MGKILELDAFQDTQNANDLFKLVGGYRMVDDAIKLRFFQRTNGFGAHAYILKQYRGLLNIELEHDSIGANPSELESAYIALDAYLDRKSTWAEQHLSEMPTSICKFDDTDQKICAIFVKCKYGIIGCGWYAEDDPLVYAQKMAAFMLYALGFINGKYDEVLWTSTYYFLPKLSKLGPTREASESIIEGLERMKFGE